MKKAKMMLAAIAVLGVVGGSLAFTAKNANHKFYYNAPSGKCTSFDVTFKSTIDINQARLYPTYSTTSSTTAACVGIFLTNDPA
jgi:hypothetical protein